MELIIKKIEKGSIFCEDFKNLTTNNTINLNRAIAVLYGPNGTGKTSLAKAFDKAPDTLLEASLDGESIGHILDEKRVHVINDQNGRNIIKGSTKDFILGENIAKEMATKERLEADLSKFSEALITTLKDRFKISKKDSALINKIESNFLLKATSDLANNRSKGKLLDKSQLIKDIAELSPQASEFDQEKLSFFCKDLTDSDPIIERTRKIALSKKEDGILKIEENTDAIWILTKHSHTEECIVCDNEIDPKSLLTQKTGEKTATINSLSQESKEILEKILERLPSNDPFNMKSTLTKAVSEGDQSHLKSLIEDLDQYQKHFNTSLEQAYIDAIKANNLLKTLEEYESLIKEKPEFGDEDIKFIDAFINDCIDKKIKIERAQDGNIRLLLGENEFLEKQREQLELSNGEQNFLSLSFELLKAKKSDAKIIILDDPISSFDSIYKNKIAYAITRILKSKKSIILTHNTDLIRLLEHQHPDCFSLYFINNTPEEVNGIIPINNRESKILIYLHELLTLLRTDIVNYIKDEKSFLISLIPFMRGYCQIINRQDLKNDLTQLMHGYKTESKDITSIYAAIFGPGIIKTTISVSAQDIIGMETENLTILDANNLPLLDKTLRHTLTYLYLRLNVEKKLADKFSINTKKHDMLSSIITASFQSQSNSDIENRTFFLSRKTLLNEFNHFEIDMNIFQPAIDITNRALKKEKHEIIERLKSL